MGILKQELLKKLIVCQFEGCKNKAEVNIIDSETEQEVMICSDCDNMLRWER